MNFRREYLNIAVFTLLLILSALYVNIQTKIVFDQGFIGYVFSFSIYPPLESGIVSHLVVGLFNKFISCPPEKLNYYIKNIAMFMYCIPAFMLGKKIIKNQYLLLVFTLFLFTSQYPFLWLSSELFVGSLLFISIYAIISNWNVLLISLVLVLLGFTKPDILFLSLVLLIYCAVTLKTKREKIMLVAGYIIIVFLLLLPGIINKRTDYFKVGGRAFMSFGQHYACLVYKHQVIKPAPEPWGSSDKYMNSSFPEAKTVKDVIVMHTGKYADFVLLSIRRGIGSAKRICRYLLIFIPLIFIYHLHRKLFYKEFGRISKIEQIILVSLFGFIPIFLFSYPHVRYLARYYPLFIIYIMVFIEKLISEKKGLFNLTLLSTSFLVLFISFKVNLYWLLRALSRIKNISSYWFPD